MTQGDINRADLDADVTAQASGRPIVIVPRVPGPLRTLGAKRQGDELDELIDDLFGPSTDEGPGVFDLGLVVAGVALVGWSWLSGGGGPWFVIGAGLVILGIALPARSILRAWGRRRTARLEGRAKRTGAVLDTSSAAVGGLVGSYDALLHAAALPGVTVGREAVEAGHAAVLEAASLLGGRPPLTPEEEAYVERRTTSIRDLTAQLIRADRTWRRSRLADQGDVTADARAHAAAVVEAREQLEAAAGMAAVDELDRLRDQLRDRPHDGGDPGAR